MHIAFASQEYPPGAHGGIGTTTHACAHGLSAMGHQVHVITHASGSGVADGQDGPVHLVRVNGFDDELPIATDAVRWITYSMRVAAALAKLQARAPLDLVVFPEWGGEGYIHLLNRESWNRAPAAVVQIHGPLVMFGHTMGWPDINSEFYKLGTQMEGTSLRLADAIISSSRCSASWCANHYRLCDRSIATFHMGVDTELFSPRKVPRDSRPTVLFVGRITDNKGVFILLEAICRLTLRVPGLRLRVIGHGEPQTIQRLQRQAQESGCAEVLELVGFMPREDISEHLCRADLLAGPSIYEGGPGYVYLEAMSCGLPVIASEGSGAAEVVTHGQTGLLVKPGDVESLELALEQLLSNDELRRRIGSRARLYALQEADRQSCLSRMEAHLQSVADACRTSA